MLGKTLLQPTHIAHQATTDVERLEQPFVGVQHQRVGALHATEQRPAALRQYRGGTVCSVHMQPQVLLLADIGDGVQRIDGAGIGGAGGGDDTKGPPPASPIFVDGFFERRHVEPQLLVHRHQSNLLGLKAENSEVLPIRRVSLVGAVNNRSFHLPSELHLPCGNQPGEIGYGATTDEDSTAGLWKPTQLQ